MTAHSASRGKVLVVISAADSIPLLEGGAHETGIFIGELAEPAGAMLEAGYELVFASPGGVAPTVDEDSKRLIYWHGSKKKLARAESAYAALIAKGLDKPLVLEELAADPRRLQEFDALFVPGGHGPLVDLYYENMFESKRLNGSMGRVLQYFHEAKKPTGLICHAPTVLATAPMVNGKSIYADYRVTAISRMTEWFNEDLPGMRVIRGHVGLYPNEVLTALGVKYVYRRIPMVPYVVEDRELMTGQDPFSAGLMARRWVEKLNAYKGWK